jgi:menaquinone-dependent protoporphyrinogen IX oxidase
MKKTLLALLAFMFIFTTGISAKGEKMKVLIIYGSFMGSTKEVSEAVKKELETKNCSVDISPAASATGDISGYSLVILGSAIHGATPHPDVLAYVGKNREALKKAKTAVFIVCATITSANRKIKEKAEHYPEKIAVGFTPVSTAVFGGVLGEPRNGFERFMAKLFLGLEKFGDFREWPKIKEWAASLVKYN